MLLISRTHQQWEEVELPLWGRAGQGQVVWAWHAPLPPRRDGEGGSDGGGHGAECGGGRGAECGGGGGDERGEWHRRERLLPPPGGASHVPLPTSRPHHTCKGHPHSSLNTYVQVTTNVATACVLDNLSAIRRLHT